MFLWNSLLKKCVVLSHDAFSAGERCSFPGVSMSAVDFSDQPRHENSHKNRI